jgi:hypothetical protein
MIARESLNERLRELCKGNSGASWVESEATADAMV